ncbi:MAG: hypothetical protein BGO12_08110 [Verrucomicrobia bacterium 61-8]|nr:MAG: hypothetical protein BGO12_08110 [Verrucomicrobia bacterium 61-8]
MNVLAIFLIALGCAGVMGLLAHSGIEPNLRSAIRTTLILALVWGTGWINPHAGPLKEMTWKVWILAILSGGAVTLSWILYLRNRRDPNRSNGPALMDQINVGLAVIFVIVLLYGQTDSSLWLNGLLIVAGALLLGRARR